MGADEAVGAPEAAAGGVPRSLVFPAGLPPVVVVWEGAPLTGAPAKWVQRQARVAAGRRAAGVGASAACVYTICSAKMSGLLGFLEIVSGDIRASRL